MEEEESLVSRRPKRSTAGNRMEFALAELAIEEPQDPEEDIEFVVDKDEEDIFESDFASTDEEAVQEGIEEGDMVVREEEKRERRIARARVEKATAAAHARQRVTFNPEPTPSQWKSQGTQKPKRRVSLGFAVNAETGTIIEGAVGVVGVKRKSQRRHTVMNTSATVNRMKDAEEKRAAVPKKTKTTIRMPTQDELIARALDTEEGNIMEHRNYLRLEEEKRAKARVVKRSIEGPVLRWISKKEMVQVEVQLPSPPPPTMIATSANLSAGKFNFVYSSGIGAGTVGSQAYSMPFYAYTPLSSSMGSRSKEAATSTNGSMSYSSGNPPVPTVTTLPSKPAAPAVPPSPSAASWQQQPQPQLQPQPPAQGQSSGQPSSILFPYSPIPAAPLITHRSEDVCKNYVIHELSQSIPSKPSWKDTMSAMFGDHVKWDEVKVFTGKGRPLARPIRACPITGQPAKYIDPRTNVPFANLVAYDVLTQVLGREYAWCSALGCYVGEGETVRKETVSGRDAQGAESKTGEGDDTDEDGEAEGDELEEHSSKRLRVRMT